MYGKRVSAALRPATFARRVATALVVTGVLLGAANASSAGAHPAASPRVTTRAPRVLLIGDSILDQQGSAAAFVLRQAGVNAQAQGVWISGLLTRDQYDYGRTKLSGILVRQGQARDREVRPRSRRRVHEPQLLAAAPARRVGSHDHEPELAPAQRMIGQQARALITILRARHARVFFIKPIPSGTIKDPNPAAWNPIWRGYLPVLRTMHVPVADSAKPLERPDGLRAERKPSCSRAPQRIRLPKHDVHMTRFGAGLAGTALATYVADHVQADLRGNAAPGDATAALVPTANGRGYWLVGCDGSVYDFGNARKLAVDRATIAAHRGVVAAVPTPTGNGLWMVTSDGTIVPVGDAPSLTFTTAPSTPITAAAAVPGGNGLWATTRSGVVLHAGTAVAHGGLAGVHLAARITGIAPTHDGGGYWLAGANGAVFPFGDALPHGSIAHPRKLAGPITGIAPTADDHGYWLVGSDGGVFTFGDARLPRHRDLEAPAESQRRRAARPRPRHRRGPGRRGGLLGVRHHGTRLCAGRGRRVRRRQQPREGHPVTALLTTDLLEVWTDPDTAMEAVGTNLGIFDEDGPSPAKTLAADERLRNTLFDVLLSLVEGGALEMRPCGGGRHAFRWRQDMCAAAAARRSLPPRHHRRPSPSRPLRRASRLRPAPALPAARLRRLRRFRFRSRPRMPMFGTWPNPPRPPPNRTHRARSPRRPCSWCRRCRSCSRSSSTSGSTVRSRSSSARCSCSPAWSAWSGGCRSRARGRSGS